MCRLRFAKFAPFLIVITGLCMTSCSKRKNIWHDDMFALLQLSNERLRVIVAQSERARTKAAVIAVLQDSENALTHIGADFQDLVKKYPDINEQKPLIEKEFSPLYSELRQNLHHFLKFVSVWKEQYAHDSEFSRTMKKASLEATRIEQVTRPAERYD